MRKGGREVDWGWGKVSASVREVMSVMRERGGGDSELEGVCAVVVNYEW